MSDTKTRILDHAERLFAEQGFDGVSLREITGSAGVNLAAVNYHFQTKEALIEAVIERHVGPINTRRLELLDQMEREAQSGPVPVERLIDAFIRPVVESDMRQIRQLLGRIYGAPDEFVFEIVQHQLADVARRFIAAFGRSMPELPMEECAWRLHFTAGMLAHTMTWSRILPVFSNGMCDPYDTEALIRRMVQFAAAGIRTPFVKGEVR